MKSIFIIIFCLFLPSAISSSRAKKQQEYNVFSSSIENNYISSDMYNVIFKLNKIERSLKNLNNNLIKIDSLNGHNTKHKK
jgi:hypothetical protein